MYYTRLASIYDILGEEGFLRLPSYILDRYVTDGSREAAISRAVSAVREGRRVVIIGRAGSGKTATLAVILKRLVDAGYGIGLLNFRVAEVDNSHEKEGIVLFYDDIFQLPEDTLRALINARAFIATLREEEIPSVERKLGRRIEEVFELVRIEPMSPEKISQVLKAHATAEGIAVEEGVEEVVRKKAQGLPVYVWQLVRDVKINKMSALTKEFAERIPEGMLDYIDDILWRVLDEHPERREILLTLIILSEMPNMEMHQQLFNMVFAVAKEHIYGRKFDERAALLSDLLDRLSRYLLKSSKYSIRLPHDSWKDVLEGKSRGLMSGDISRVRAAFPREVRERIVETAAARALRRVREEGDKESLRELEEQLSMAGIEAREEVAVKPEGRTRLKLYAVSRKKVAQKRKLILTDVSLAIVSDPIYGELLERERGLKLATMERKELLKTLRAERWGKTVRIHYPETSKLSITESITKYKIEALEWLIWMGIVAVWSAFGLIRTYLPAVLSGIWWMFPLAAMFALMGLEGETKAYFEEIEVVGDGEVVRSFVDSLKRGLGRSPVAGVNRLLLRYIKERTGIGREEILASWRM